MFTWLFLILLVAWLLTKPFYWWRRGVPYLLPLPLVGSFFPAIYLNTRELLEHLYYSIPDAPYIGIHLLTKPVLLLKDAKVIQEILEEKFPCFNSRGLYAQRNKDPSARSVFHLEGDEWKSVRTKLSPHFSPAKVKTILQFGKSSLDQLADKVDEWLKMGKPTDMYKASFLLTADLTSGAFFGVQSDIFSEEEDSDFYYAATNLNTPSSMIKVYVMLSSRWLTDHLNIMPFSKRVNDFMLQLFDTCINNRIQNSGPVRNIIEGIADMMLNNPEVFDINLMRSQGVLVWAGGVETTATTLAFALYELAEHQELQRELREKLKAGEGRPLAKAIVTETLRKYPIFTCLMRKCTERCKLSTGYVVEPGTLFLIPAITIHRDPKYYPDPDKFILDRPLPKGAFLSFGGGPRICIGMRVGMSVVEEALVKLIEKFEFFPDKEPMVLKARSFFTAPKSGLRLRVQRVDSEVNTNSNKGEDKLSEKNMDETVHLKQGYSY